MGAGARASGLAILIVVSMVMGGLITAQVIDDEPAAVPATATTVPTESATSLPVLQTPSDATVDTTQAASTSTFVDLPALIEAVQDSVVVIEIDGGTDSSGGEGSGFVIDTDGHILTNYHVVEGSQRIVVRLFDGSASMATVVGADPSSDLAVIHAPFDPDLLQPVTFGDSDAVRVGDSVFAIGNPFAENFTVTSGIVSAVGRNTTSSFSQRQILNVIQTDAALNPGNSGGPLFNTTGEVIGVNSSITSPNGFRGNVGLGFAVPSNTALRFLPAMVAGEEIIHAQLGVSGHALDPIEVAQQGLDVPGGFTVTAVRGAAFEAGVQPGDIVIAIEGQPVLDVGDIAAYVDRYDVGTEVDFTVLRDGDRLELTATLQAWVE